MTPEIRRFDPTDATAVDLFYQVGEAIRKTGNTVHAPWQDERNVTAIFSDASFKGQLFIAEKENVKARLIAFYQTSDPDLGFIGWYESNDDSDLSKFLLDIACAWLKKCGCKTVLGPINGTTWNNYRFNFSNTYPLFPGDPCQPMYYPELWKTAGFTTAVNYLTEIPPREVVRPTSQPEVAKLLNSYGLALNNLTPEIAQTYFEKLHAFYHLCFPENPLFHPIDLETYADINDKVTTVLNAPHSFLITDSRDQVIAVFISFNDVYHTLYGQQHDVPEVYKKKRLVIKTLAVHPDYRNKQLGTLMINLIHHLGYENGYRQIVHALMYDDNLSAKKGREKFQTETVCRYGMLQKRL